MPRYHVRITGKDYEAMADLVRKYRLTSSNPTPFHPTYTEMQKIIQEITSALLAFCITAS
jgi:hypothetical protein